MPPTSNDVLGRRRFQLGKEQVVEEAVEKIRHAEGVAWNQITPQDYRTLREILGELWIHIERKKWENYVFSDITDKDIEKILSLAKDLTKQSTFHGAIRRIDDIISHRYIRM